jgi:hypothetical protein
VIGHLETFTQKMQAGLENADWSTRRDIIRTLVKKIEINDEEIKIVYRVGCGPFDLAPNPKRPGQDCWRRHRVTLSFTTPCRSSRRTERCVMCEVQSVCCSRPVRPLDVRMNTFTSRVPTALAGAMNRYSAHQWKQLQGSPLQPDQCDRLGEDIPRGCDDRPPDAPLG